MGCRELGLEKKPTNPDMKRAVAGVGQSRSLAFFLYSGWAFLWWIWETSLYWILIVQGKCIFWSYFLAWGIMRLYSELFETVGMKIAQLLVSQRDFLEQQRWAEIRDTISACLDAGVVPVINENDTTNTATRMFLKSDCEHVFRMSSVKLGTHISLKVLKLALCQTSSFVDAVWKKVVHPTFATRNTRNTATRMACVSETTTISPPWLQSSWKLEVSFSSPTWIISTRPIPTWIRRRNRWRSVVSPPGKREKHRRHRGKGVNERNYPKGEVSFWCHGTLLFQGLKSLLFILCSFATCCVKVVNEAFELKVDTREPGSSLGTGGMSTKIAAARTAHCAGILDL